MKKGTKVQVVDRFSGYCGRVGKVIRKRKEGYYNVKMENGYVTLFHELDLTTKISDNPPKPLKGGGFRPGRLTL